MKIGLYLLPALILLLIQCRKAGSDPTPTLPPATRTGANTFGCLVNGQLWLPSGNNGTPNSVALYDPSVNAAAGAQVNLKAYQLTATQTYLTLYVRKIDSQKRTFIMNLPAFGQSVTEAFGCYESSSGSFCGATLSYLAGQIELTRVDEKAGILAGTFWFTAVRRGSADTLKVTQGRFDYKI